MGNLFGFDADKQSIAEFVIEDLKVGKKAIPVRRLINELIQDEEDYLEFVHNHYKHSNKVFHHLMEFKRAKEKVMQ